MKNRFAQILSILCALILVMNAVSVFAEDAPATPTDLEPQTQQEEIIPAEEEETQPEEEEPADTQPAQLAEILPEEEKTDETQPEEIQPEEIQPAEKEQEELISEEKPGEADPVKEEPQEEQDGAIESAEVIISKAIRIGGTWEGLTKDTKPALLKLDVDKNQTIHLLVEGKKVVWLTLTKADRPEASPQKILSDTETKRLLTSFEVEKASYLIQIGPEEPNHNANITVTVMDDEAYAAWMEQQETKAPQEQTEPDPAEEAEQPETEEELVMEDEILNRPESEEKPENSGEETEQPVPETEEGQESEEESENRLESEETLEGFDSETSQQTSERDAEENVVTQNEESIISENEQAAELPAERNTIIHLSWSVDESDHGNIAHFTSTMTGYENLNYTLQWQVSPDAEVWTDYEGATDSTLDVKITKDLYGAYWRLMIYVEEPQQNE